MKVVNAHPVAYAQTRKWLEAKIKNHEHMPSTSNVASVVDLLAGVTTPAPETIVSIRLSAGVSQAEAARLVGLGRATRWSEYERGVQPIDPARWALFLLATGQHPRAQLAIGAHPLPGV